jgi:hypothetical protein
VGAVVSPAEASRPSMEQEAADANGVEAFPVVGFREASTSPDGQPGKVWTSSVIIAKTAKSRTWGRPHLSLGEVSLDPKAGPAARLSGGKKSVRQRCCSELRSPRKFSLLAVFWPC